MTEQEAKEIETRLREQGFEPELIPNGEGFAVRILENFAGIRRYRTFVDYRLSRWAVTPKRV